MPPSENASVSVSGGMLSRARAIVDSRSVKTTGVGGERSYDGGKKVKGRKRHLLVDQVCAGRPWTS